MSGASFYRAEPSAATSWRMAVLMGDNSRTYKFALAAALLAEARAGRDEVPVEDLATRYVRELAGRSPDVSQASARTLSGPTDFVNVVREEREALLEDRGPSDRLHGMAVQNIVTMPMKHFHNAQGGVAHRFFEVEGVRGLRVVRLTPAMLEVVFATDALEGELASRWSIVESAFAAGVSSRSVGLYPSADGTELFMPHRRAAVASSLPALRGFQHGRCFYCHALLSPEPGAAHVDHVFPWSLMNRLQLRDLDLNGLWNLVAACAACNLGKSDRLPGEADLEALVARNEAVLASPEPLKVGLRASMEAASTGSSGSPARRRQLVRDVARRMSGG
ncbi:HNH endonuclease [Kineococcus terrestris]|uniref:HNH endonuclease n=1 Tax=Kineococcus terrestris TaxID=2044856 RepID=UPI0034DADDA1